MRTYRPRRRTHGINADIIIPVQYIHCQIKPIDARVNSVYNEMASKANKSRMFASVINNLLLPFIFPSKLRRKPIASCVAIVTVKTRFSSMWALSTMTVLRYQWRTIDLLFACWAMLALLTYLLTSVNGACHVADVCDRLAYWVLNIADSRSHIRKKNSHSTDFTCCL